MLLLLATDTITYNTIIHFQKHPDYISINIYTEDIISIVGWNKWNKIYCSLFSSQYCTSVYEHVSEWDFFLIKTL